MLVDSNVLIDLAQRDPEWFAWSSAQVANADDELAINPVVYAEVSVAFADRGTLDRRFPPTKLARLPLPWSAAFLAGKAFVAYRRAGGSRRSPLPDFFIGAHAETEGFRLLTRDPSRYRTYFPTVELIAP